MTPIRSAVVVVAAVVAALTSLVPGASAAAGAEIALGTHNSHYGDGSFEPFAGVIGWQEVESAAARAKLDTRLGAEYRTFYPAEGPAKAVPISWRAERFSLLGSGSVRTHDGEAGVTPARYVNWVNLEVKGTGARFTVVNTHFISGAWSGHPERQARWTTHYQVLRDKVADLLRNHPGQPVFVLGDFNRAKVLDFPGPVEHVAVQGVSGVPIDQVYAPSDIAHGQVTREPKWGSDHYAYRLTATV